jgi:hypothetical protein
MAGITAILGESTLNSEVVSPRIPIPMGLGRIGRAAEIVWTVAVLLHDFFSPRFLLSTISSLHSTDVRILWYRADIVSTTNYAGSAAEKPEARRWARCNP